MTREQFILRDATWRHLWGRKLGGRHAIVAMYKWRSWGVGLEFMRSAVAVFVGPLCVGIGLTERKDVSASARRQPSSPTAMGPIGRAAEVIVTPAKPRVRVSRDGWIRNVGGGFPFHPGTLVELAFDDGRMLLKPHGVETAGYWHERWWKRDAKGQGRNIAFYRIVRLAPPVTAVPRIAR